MRLAKGIKIFQKKRKTKIVNMLAKDIKTLLKKVSQQEYCCERHKIFPENEKQRLVEYGRHYYIILKT